MRMTIDVHLEEPLTLHDGDGTIRKGFLRYTADVTDIIEGRSLHFITHPDDIPKRPRANWIINGDGTFSGNSPWTVEIVPTDD